MDIEQLHAYERKNLFWFWVFLSPGYGLCLLFMTSTPVLRSKLSKLVDPSEQGQPLIVYKCYTFKTKVVRIVFERERAQCVSCAVVE